VRKLKKNIKNKKKNRLKPIPPKQSRSACASDFRIDSTNLSKFENKVAVSRKKKWKKKKNCS